MATQDFELSARPLFDTTIAVATRSRVAGAAVRPYAFFLIVLVVAGAAFVSMPAAAAQDIDTPTAKLQFDSGFKHSCAVRDGSVECWGSNSFDQLGTDQVGFSSTPIPVSGISDAVAVTTGLFTSCAVRSTGAVLCWGDNRGGELGDGTNTSRATPAPVVGVSGAIAVTLGRQHGCALLSDKTVKCWGTNWDGRLGDGTDVTRLTAVAVSGLTGAAQVSAGVNHTCARLETGSIECWGGNFEGQLGAGEIGELSLTPVSVAGISTATDISVHDHTCAVLANGDVRCWGQNRHGQVGDGTMVNRSIPADVTLDAATAVSAGHDVSCAVLTTGTVSCWGSNNNGETGNGSPSEEELTPTPAIGVSGVAAVNAAAGYSCAVQTDASVQCWGFNRFGQLGNGTTVDSLTPVHVADEALLAVSTVTCVNDDGVISVELTNPTATARTYLVMFNNTTRGGTVGAQGTATQTISGLVDTTITVKVTDTSAAEALTVLFVPEEINCDPGMNATAAVSCVDGNGVITLTVNNPTSGALIYLASFNNTRRAGLIAANGSAVQTISGLVDATFTVTVVNRTAEPDIEVYNEPVAVQCDSGGPEALTVAATTTCAGDAGVITFQLENTALLPVSYLVSVNNTRRSGTLAPGATTTKSVSGLADLTFTIRAFNTSPDPDVVLIDRAETVNCSGDIVLAATHAVSCQGMTGSISVTLSNESGRSRYYQVAFNNTTRSSTVAADSTKVETISGLGTLVLTVTATDTTANPDQVILNEQVQVNCNSALIFTPSVTCIGNNGQISVTIENTGETTRSYSVFINNTRRIGSVAGGQTVTQTMGGLVDTTFSVRGIDTSAAVDVTELDTTVDVLCDIPQVAERRGVDVRVAAERP